MRLSQASSDLRAVRAGWLCLALVITFASHALPEWGAQATWPLLSPSWRAMGFQNFFWLWTLLFGLLLIARSPARFGVRIGDIRRYGWRTLFVCAVPVILTAAVYPFLPVQPFRGAPIGMWLISPAAQELVFMGFLYTHLDRVFPGDIHPRVPVHRGLVITAVFFMLWHVPNFASLDHGFVVFQLGYTFAAALWAGLTRQWTGSLLYTLLTHMTTNFIAWL